MRDFIDWPFPVVFLSLVISILLSVGLIMLPITRMNIRSGIAQFKAVAMTLEQARGNAKINPLELAAIQQKVINSNIWLASIQYWNTTIFDWWIPDEVKNLKSIK